MTIQHCKTCGARLDRDGSCPKCLMVVGLDSETLDRELPPLEVSADRIPGYEITGTIGRGGMGTVFLAKHLHLDRQVAIKVLAPEGVAGQDFADRFRREARTMAGLAHPNVVSIHDFGEDGELYWLVMEQVDGVNLRELLAEDMTPQQAFDIVRQVCDALHYAHQQGIVHRDIKPENILVDRTGRVKLGDFGLAKLMHHGSVTRLTGSRHVMGTPLYMAPEQVNTPLAVDHRADIYALGVVLYELLTGKLPVGRFDPPSEAGRVDSKLDAVVLKALEHTPDRRYQHVSDVRRDLDSAVGGNEVALAPSGVRATAPVPPAIPRSQPELPLFVRWWELLLSLIAVPACGLDWTITPHYWDHGPQSWAAFAGVFLSVPVVVVVLGWHKIHQPLPWLGAGSAALALACVVGAVTTELDWQPTAHPYIVGWCTGIILLSNILRMMPGAFQSRAARLQLVTSLISLASAGLAFTVWGRGTHASELTAIHDPTGGFCFGASIGVPLLLLAGAGLGVRWWSGVVTLFGGGSMIFSVFLWLQGGFYAIGRATGWPWVYIAVGSVLVLLGLLMFELDARLRRKG